MRTEVVVDANWPTGAPPKSDVQRPFFCARNVTNGLVYMLRVSPTFAVCELTASQAAVLGGSCVISGCTSRDLMVGLPGQRLRGKHIGLRFDDVYVEGAFGDTSDEAAESLAAILSTLG